MLLHDKWQETITITMDDLLIGTGWCEVEKCDNVYFRWTDSDSVSSIHINPRRDLSNRLNISIYDSLNNELLDGVHLEADGIPLYTTLGKSRGRSFFTSVLPEDRSKRENEKTILSLHLPQKLLSSQTKPMKKTNRLRGIALSRIDIFPSVRSLFTAQKYNDPEPFDGLYYIDNNPGVQDAVIQGAYSSAYEYFLKHDRIGMRDSFSLHEKFDECPGDLFDILNVKILKQSGQMKEKYQKDIKHLYNIVYRQGDIIRSLQNQSNG